MYSIVRPLFVLGVFTGLFALGVFVFKPNDHPLANALLINLLASGITVIGTTILIDRSMRRAKDKDAEPGLKMAQKLLGEETGYVLSQIGIMLQKAQDENYTEESLDQSLGFHVALAKREKNQIITGLELAKSFERTQIVGKQANIAVGVSYMTQRLCSALDDILHNFSASISNANCMDLYKIKQSLVQNNSYVGTGDDLSLVGYESPDEGYIPNNDYPEGYISSLHAYHIHQVIMEVLKLHKIKLHLPL